MKNDRDLITSYNQLEPQQQEFYGEVISFFESRGVLSKKLFNLLSSSLISVLNDDSPRCIFEAIEDAGSDVIACSMDHWQSIKTKGEQFGIVSRQVLKQNRYLKRYPQEPLTSDIVRKYLRDCFEIDDRRVIGESNMSDIDNIFECQNTIDNKVSRKNLSYQKMIKRLGELGCEPTGKMKGSHQRRKTPHHENGFTVVRPHGKHNDTKMTKRGTRKSMIKEAGFSENEF